MKRVHLNDLDIDEGHVHRHEGSLFTGVGEERGPNGRVREEITFVDGMEHGPSRLFNSAGALLSECTLHNGSAHGTSREWDELGRLRKEVIHQHGVVISRRDWNENGDVTSTFQRPAGDAQWELARARELASVDPPKDS